jgi:hypothetical protein
MSSKLVLLACLASTLFMSGVIWFVQVVHYPLFERVDPGAFRRYHADHTRLTTYVVVLPMVVELLASFYLVVRRPEGVGPSLAWLGLGAALLSWASTLLLSVPSHERLSLGWDTQTHLRLVRTNAVRLVSWTAHSVILLVMTAQSIR